MGCGGSGVSKNTIPIGNSIVHLLQTGQNDLIINRLQSDPSLCTSTISFRGDTIAHYACFKNNKELVRYLKRIDADFTKKNEQGVTPADLATDDQILKIIGVMPAKTKEAKAFTATTIITDNGQQAGFDNSNSLSKSPRRLVSSTIVDSSKTNSNSMNSQANIYAQVAPTRRGTQLELQQVKQGQQKHNIRSPKVRRVKRRQTQLTKIIMANLDQNSLKQQ